MLIYCAEFSNGKKYIGCTKNNLEIRKKEHLLSAKNGSPFKFHKAIRKYGSNNIKWRVLKKCKHKIDLINSEKRFIKRYKSNHVKYGYNSSCGGEFGDCAQTPEGRLIPSWPTCANSRSTTQG